MYAGNAGFVEALYEDYLRDPLSVDPEWRRYFDSVKDRSQAPDVAHGPVQQAFLALANAPRRAGAAEPMFCAPDVDALVNAYRTMGHLRAHFNPLELEPHEAAPELDPSFWGLTGSEPAGRGNNGLGATIGEVVARLKQIYCGAIGYEFGDLPRVEREWLQNKIEAVGGRKRYDKATKLRIFEKLNAAEGLERYLHMRYVGQKRFSLEGGDTLIPMLDFGINLAGTLGVKECVLGMAHRGRLNVLINILGKKTSDLFDEFEGKKVDIERIAGDVKYHLGFSSDIETPGGPMHLSLGFNPSHLELIDPLVEGSSRARQDRRGDTTDRTSVLPILIHGDAAVNGQGIVAETLNLSQLRGFATGGTLHLVINNQIGFSIADPRDARSGRYCTDIAKFIEAPVFHVSGDDPEAAIFTVELADEFRQTFKKDVFVDLVCYRRLGHNESDEPRATNPRMYQLIDQHQTPREIYQQKLEAEGVLAPGEAKQLADRYRDKLDSGAAMVEVSSEGDNPGAKVWKPYLNARWTAAYDTTVSLEALKQLAAKLTELPAGFTLHPRVAAIFKAREEMTAGRTPLDWGMAENLAYATLLTQGHPVRISGQDSGRGTFFHRHAVLHDQQHPDTYDNRTYLPLAHLAPNQARVEVIDSTLSELAVLGFEYGYSSTDPQALVIWEAQYGDFANGAQAVIDQYVSAAETKWERLSAIVMMLPHGYEGQGPEHSSARLERYLQLCADDNMQVCVPSTPAQMYHMLRRQVLRPYRKPLIIMSPKSMLRNKASVSSLDELANGRFLEVIGDPREARGVNRVVLCSGKVYYDLADAREKHGLTNVAIVRLEQLYPFPEEALRAELSRYNGAQVVWTQEEPLNMGAWYSLQDYLVTCLHEGQALSCVSRPRSASPAVGSVAKHNAQQQNLITRALAIETPVLTPANS